MHEPTQAELFIRTLEEMYEEFCETRRARRIGQRKALAKQFVRAFPTAQDDGMGTIDWLP